jgi:hypothetical protein
MQNSLRKRKDAAVQALQPMTSILIRSFVLIALAPGLLAAQGAAAGAAQAARIALDPFSAPPARSIVRAELTGQELARPQSATIMLNLRNRAELEARVGRGEIVSRSEMAARYYHTHESWSAVAGWASAQGLAVEPEDSTRMSVTARGHLARVADALHTRFARVRGDDAEQLWRPRAPGNLRTSLGAPNRCGSSPGSRKCRGTGVTQIRAPLIFLAPTRPH